MKRQQIKTERKKTEELCERNRSLASRDCEDEAELKEMIEIFQSQSQEIMQLKSVLVRYVMKGIPVDPRTGKKNLRARPSISEITRPKSSRIRLRSGRLGAPVMMENLQKIESKPRPVFNTKTIVDLKL